MTSSVLVWDDALRDYDLGGEHPLHPVRLELTMLLATALGVLDGVVPLVPAPAADTEIERVHTPSYVAAVRAAPGSGPDPAHGLGTADNPVFAKMHEASALVCGASLLAAQRIADGSTRRAVNIAGGLHHAMPGHAAGFCVYNDCAVAIAWLLANGVDRIAYVDVDVHHGDGVQAVFYDDPRVLTVSVHQHPATLWPGTGWPRECGTGDAAGTVVNLPLPPGTGDAAWLRAFDAVVPAVLRDFRPEVLITQCGADTHREDPLADLALTVDGHRAIYRRLRALAEQVAGGRWLVLGGGGYGLFRVVPRSWTHLLATVLDADIDPVTPLPADWTARAVQVAGGAPLPTAMTDGVTVLPRPWDGGIADAVDRAIVDTRRAVFPLRGLDPDDPRD